ncbi:MAG: hypothetical protein AVDCRST_MAG09-1022, partial [uncultured Sphingomonas sp.]
WRCRSSPIWTARLSRRPTFRTLAAS